MVNNPILARFPGLSHLVQSKRPTLQDAFPIRANCLILSA
jgi:hypothetical protein